MASTSAPIINTDKKKFTYQDYLKTPDDIRYELIGGELLMTPAPVPRHQKIKREIEYELLRFVKANKIGEIFDAPCDVYLDEENVVQPDLFFISKERTGIIGEKNIQGAPDLVIEIISESNAYRDLVQKKRLYAKNGVKEYWIVIPEEETIEIYILKDSVYTLHKTFNKEDVLESPYLTDFRLKLTSVF